MAKGTDDIDSVQPDPTAREIANGASVTRAGLGRGLGRLIPAAPAPTVAEREPAAHERVFAARMKRERLRRGWRQEDFAKELASSGLPLHPSAIAKMEREPDPEKGIEPRAIRLGEAAVIAQALGLTTDRMLSDDDLSGSAIEIARLERRLADAQDRFMHMQALAREAQAQFEQIMDEVERARSARTRRWYIPEGADVDEFHDGETREAFEHLIGYWFRRSRRDLIEHGWGSNGKDEAVTPQWVSRTIILAGEIFPDLRQVCIELAHKIRDDAKWWHEEGAKLHDERMRELAAEFIQPQDELTEGGPA